MACKSSPSFDQNLRTIRIKRSVCGCSCGLLLFSFVCLFVFQSNCHCRPQNKFVMTVLQRFTRGMWSGVTQGKRRFSSLQVISAPTIAFCIFTYFFNLYSVKWCASKAKLDGKTVIVTGASAGIGKAAAKNFANRGAKVILACRNKSKAKKVADEIVAATGNENVFVRIIDTSSLSSVRSFAEEINRTESRVDILVLNAGISGPSQKCLTEDGLEMVMATNHFGHFLLVNLLSDLMENSKPSRIVVITSFAHRYVSDISPRNLNFDSGYTPPKATLQGYLCNVFMTRHMAEHFKGRGVTANCFCPRFVHSSIFDAPHVTLFTKVPKYFFTLFGRSPEQGAQTMIYLAVSEEVKDKTGGFYIDCKESEANVLCSNEDLRRSLWEATQELVNLKAQEKKIK